MDSKKPFNKELIRTQFLRHKQQWTAFVTWKGYDLQEYGETKENAIHFLLTRHAKFLGIEVSRAILTEKIEPNP